MNLIKIKSLLILPFLFSFIGCNGKNLEIKESNLSEQTVIHKDFNELLKEALESSDYETVGSLIDEGADENFVYKEESLLYYFMHINRTDIALKLIEKGADVNWINPKNGRTPLAYAIYMDNLELVRKILTKEIDIGYKDFNRQTYFSECLAYKRYDCLDMLLSYSGMLENIRESYESWYYLIYSWTEKTPEIIHRIYGNDIVISDDIPVLMISIDENNPEAVKFFIDLGIDSNKKYYDERSDKFITPLEKAYQTEHFLLHIPSLDFRYSENDKEVNDIKSIIELLRESVIIVPSTISGDIVS